MPVMARRPRIEEAIVAAGLLLVAVALLVPWWSRPADEGSASPFTWQAPATNINIPLYVAAGTALLLLLLGRARPARPGWRRALWVVPFLFAGLAGLIALIELGYLEVYDDARLGMPLGLAGLALLCLGCIVNVARSSARRPGVRT